VLVTGGDEGLHRRLALREAALSERIDERHEIGLRVCRHGKAQASE
jgi:hypothetical protein